MMSDRKQQSCVLRPNRRIFWRVVGAFLLLGIVFAILYPGVEYLSWIRGEQHCRKDFQRFSRALMTFTNERHLPPAYFLDTSGRRVHSWRPYIIDFLDWMEYIGSGDYYDFKEPWDGPANTSFLGSPFSAYYCCPVYAKDARYTSYLCVLGGTLWPVPKARNDGWKDRNSEFASSGGGLVPNSGKYLLLVEVMESNIPWTKPEDINLSELASLLREDPSGARFRSRIRRVAVLDAPKTVILLDPATDLKEIKKLVESESAAQENRPKRSVEK